MNYAFINGHIYENGQFLEKDLFVTEGKITVEKAADAQIIDCRDKHIMPGFIDVHVHLREPGLSHKETIKTGTLAAASAGYTHVCSMPNVLPVPDQYPHLKEQLALIEEGAIIQVLPYGAITENLLGKTLADWDALAPYCVAFTDDGKGVQDDAMMIQALQMARKHNKILAAHCEDETLLNHGYIHDGVYAKAHHHRGIPSACEWKHIERDLNLLAKYPAPYHVCHISTKESVELIRQAKKDGLNVSCETAPHYLILDDSHLKEDGAYKMNPPLRSKADREALLAGIVDGTIDMIATDHAPHTAEEKSFGLEKSAMGIVGLETAFPILYTYLVKKNILSLNKLVALMHDNPRKRFSIGNDLAPGNDANFCIYDLSQEYIIDPLRFFSMGKATPFKDYSVFGRNLITVYRGKIVYQFTSN